MVLYLYFALVPFATIILDVSIPSLVDINLSLNFFYIAVFLIGITVINQIFKSYVQALKYSESKNSFKQTTSSGEKNPIAASKSDSGTIFNIETPKENTVKVEKQKESPNSSAMQVILSFLFWGFGLYWIGGLFGYPYIIMPTIPLLSLIPGLPTFDANTLLAINNLIFFVVGFIVFVILYEIFAPKKSK